MATVTVERRLRCESVEDGFGCDEKLIVVRDKWGEHWRFVVPAGAVRGGCVTVQAFERDGRTWAVIPSLFILVMIDEGDLLDPDAPPWDRAAADRRDRGLADVFG